LGVGEALTGADEAMVQEMVRQWPFFESTLKMVEMVLAKSDAGVAARYDMILVDETIQRIGEDLRVKLEQTRHAVRSALDHEELLADNPTLARSIAVRNPYVDPLNMLQAVLLMRLRAVEDPTLHRALQVTINGIAAGMRNTG